VPRLLIGFILILTLSRCSGPTVPDNILPLEAPIDVHLISHPSDLTILWPEKPEGIYLRFISRRFYPDPCYRFRTQKSLGPITLLTRVLHVYRPGSVFCAAVLAPASSLVYLGDLEDGNYSLVIADPEKNYPGVLMIESGNLEVVFPDTTMFHVSVDTH